MKFNIYAWDMQDFTELSEIILTFPGKIDLFFSHANLCNCFPQIKTMRDIESVWEILIENLFQQLNFAVIYFLAHFTNSFLKTWKISN